MAREFTDKENYFYIYLCLKMHTVEDPVIKEMMKKVMENIVLRFPDGLRLYEDTFNVFDEGGEAASEAEDD